MGSTPEVHVFPPLDNLGPIVPIRFVVSHPDSKLVNVTVEFSSGIGAFADATASAYLCDSLSGLPAPDAGADYRFMWDAAADKVQDGAVQIRLTASDGVSSSTPSIISFNLSTQAPDPPPAPQAPPATVPVLSMVSGDAQSGAAGQFFPNRLAVRVTDSPTGSDLESARVTFQVLPSPDGKPPVVEIRPGDISFWTTRIDPANLVAGAVVEARAYALPGVTGSAVVRAQLLGTHGPTVDFHLTVVAPSIVVSSTSVALSRDGDPSNWGFEGNRFQPSWITIAADNALVSASLVRIPSASGSSVSLVAIPIDRAQPARITAAVSTDPSIAVQSTLVPAPPPAQSTRQTSVTVDPQTGQPGFTSTEVDLFLQQPLTGPPPAPQVGYPGLTVPLPLIELRDTTGHPYTQQSSAGVYDPSSPPPSPGLTLHYMVISGGSLSLNQDGSGGFAQLNATLTQKVYFNLSGPGPWRAMASFGGIVADDLSPTLTWQDSSGASHSTRSNLDVSLGNLTLTYTFCIQVPTNVSIIDSTGNVVTEVKAGDRVRVRVDGLSPSTAASPDKLTLEAVTFAGYSAQQFTPASASPVFKQTVNLHVTTPQQLESHEILVTHGNPDPTTFTPSTVTQQVIPGGWLRVYWTDGDDTITVALPVRSRSWDCLRRANPIGPQENALGSTPMSGAFDTVNLRSGEFRYSISDIEFPCRSGNVAFSRTYRSQMDNDGPLGPGWTFEHDARLDVSGFPSIVRWCTDSGLCHDFTPGSLPPPGTIARLDSQAIDNDHGAWQITDPHRNAVHFNTDGSIGFRRDHVGNRLTYRYNEAAQLLDVTDPHGQKLTFDYWKGRGVDPKVVGRLKSVTDSAGRAVAYAYYTAADILGGPGMLKSVKYPANPTTVDSSSIPNDSFTRAESYEYEKDPQNPGHWRLIHILDTNASIWLVNGYDSGRINTQEYGNGSFGFVYTEGASTYSTAVTDRSNAQVTYTFPDSPLSDGAAPITRVETAAQNRTYQTTYNGDGLQTLSSSPVGDQISYVYDDGHSVADFRDKVLRHGNLLAAHHQSNTGRVRIWAYQHDNDYNYVTRSVGPEGHIIPVLSGMFATRYFYQALDPQTSVGGQLTEVWQPQALHMVIAPTTPGASDRQMRWICDVPLYQYAYNSYGLLKRSSDPHGVITEYSYYPEQDPTGVNGGTASPDGGGLPARVVRDVAGTLTDPQAANSRRQDQYLTDVPLSNRQFDWIYNKYGVPNRVVDSQTAPMNLELKGQPNALGEVTNLILDPDGIGTDPPLGITQTITRDFRGLPLSAAWSGAAPNASPSSEAWGRDAIGHVTSRQLQPMESL